MPDCGVALTFAHDVPVVPDGPENDSAPFIGGDQSYGWNSHDGNRQFCTTGIAVENSSGEDGLIEAGHCFTPHNGVYTDGRFLRPDTRMSAPLPRLPVAPRGHDPACPGVRRRYPGAASSRSRNSATALSPALSAAAGSSARAIMRATS